MEFVERMKDMQELDLLEDILKKILQEQDTWDSGNEFVREDPGGRMTIDARYNLRWLASELRTELHEKGFTFNE